VLAPVWSTARQPRFAMSFAMVFFSVSIALNVAGVRLGALRAAPASQRPGARLLRDLRQGGQVLRKHSLRVRTGIAGTRPEAGNGAGRTCPAGKGEESQQQYQRHN